MKRLPTFIMVLLCVQAVFCQTKKAAVSAKKHSVPVSQGAHKSSILPGAYQVSEYLPMLKGKRIGVFANQTSTVAGTHLIDTLQKLGVNITKIFGPEHGFRGTAGAGEKVNSYIDEKTGIKVISLYQNKNKPSADDLANVDVMLFDIQDVGVRFYTFISSLQYFMESALEHNKPLIILDRPNPNGFYVDGPVLDTSFRSFVGMQPVPIVYGMTLGEYANFLIGEGLLDKVILASWMMHLINDTAGMKKNGGNGMNITVIKCRNYTHKSRYVLPERPSPNLPTMGSIYWYPSICLLEGTVLSEGRGTDKPFQVFGHPSLPDTLYSFTPIANAGTSNPKFKGHTCYGWNVSASDEDILNRIDNKLQLKYLLQAYQAFPDKENFFIKGKREGDYFFNKLAGNAALMQQVKEGKTEAEIRASWEPKLTAFKKLRKKYLMYPDFE